MTDPRPGNGVPRLMRLLARALERTLEEDDGVALETLQRELEDGAFSEDDVQTVIAVLESFAASSGPAGESAVEHAPGREALRVPSPEERQSLSPEAWGFLLDLRGRGSLDALQFERVLDLLMGSGVRPVGVEQARQTATLVALEGSAPMLPEDVYGEEHDAH